MDPRFPTDAIIDRDSSWTRRELLRNCALGFGSLAAASMLAKTASGDEFAPHFFPRAKRIIFLFMKGGPSQVDTFDEKPLLRRDDGKPLPFAKPRVQFAPTGNLLRSPWKFHRHGESGSSISELFPELARHADDLCFVHSLHGTNAAHGGASLKLHTGSDTAVRPSMGAWVTYGLGHENANLPAFITICPTLAHGGVKNWGSAFLPAWCQGTPLGVASQPSTQARMKYAENSRLNSRIQRVQLDLLADMNRRFASQAGPRDQLDARLESFELAFRMQSTMPDAQDLSGESAATLKLYGLDDRTTEDFGRQCLLARRFAERGVRFIQVTHSDTNVQWDQHSNLKAGHEKNALEVDRPIAALLTDLKCRGLLQDTLVFWAGEFGRTPTAEGKDGRDHNPHGFTVWLAGGGVRGGYHFGQTDDYGYFAAVDKVHLHDLHATLLYALGIDHQRLTYRYSGRDFRLTDVSGNVVHEVFV